MGSLLVVPIIIVASSPSIATVWYLVAQRKGVLSQCSEVSCDVWKSTSLGIAHRARTECGAAAWRSTQHPVEMLSSFSLENEQ